MYGKNQKRAKTQIKIIWKRNKRLNLATAHGSHLENLIIYLILIIAIIYLSIHVVLMVLRGTPQEVYGSTISLSSTGVDWFYMNDSRYKEETPVEHQDDSEQEEEPMEPKMESLGIFQVTAYCLCPRCCGIWSAQHPSRIGTDYVQKTATGTIPTAGRTISADWLVVPQGTRVYIEGLGEFIVEDEGSAVKNNVIDMLMGTHEEALKWGRQNLEIFRIIEGEPDGEN